MSPVHIRNSICIHWLCVLNSSSMNGRKKALNLKSAQKNIQVWFLSLLLHSYSGEKSNKVTHWWSHTCASALDIHRAAACNFIPMTERCGTCASVMKLPLCTSSFQQLPINHCLLKYFLLWRPLDHTQEISEMVSFYNCGYWKEK